MSLYYRTSNPQEIRDLSGIMDAWIEANNPKRNDWEPLPEQPSDDAVWVNGEWVIVEPTPPTQVTPAQIRLWLQSQGITLDFVEQFINSIPDVAARAEAKIRWEYGLVVLRTDPMISQFATVLGMTTEQIDSAFLEASLIQ
jgi:hypothetical protein